MSRRALIFALAAALLWPAAARAQDFSTRPIRLIVPFAAGGAADLFARSLANGLGAELGQQVVVETRAGAGGLTGVDVAAKSAPDGYTICLAGAAALPAVPSTAELGYAAVNSDNWYGLVAPAHTPANVLDALRTASLAVLTSAELKKQFDSQNALPSPSSPDEFAAFVRAEQVKWGPVVRATGVKLE